MANEKLTEIISKNYHPSFLRTFDQTEKPVLPIRLEKVKKIIDAQCEFNQLLAKQILTDNNKFVRILASFYIKDLSIINFDKVLEKAPPSSIQMLKQGLARGTLNDLRDYRLLRNIFQNESDLENVDVEHLYFSVFLMYRMVTMDLQATPLGIMKRALSFFGIEENKIKKLAKKELAARLTHKADNSSITDIKCLEEILALLSPFVSHEFEDFLQNIQVESDKGSNYFSFSSEFLVKNNHLVDQCKKLSSLMTEDHNYKINDLGYQHIVLSHFMDYLKAYDAILNVVSSGLDTTCKSIICKFFKDYKLFYQLEQTVRQEIKDLIQNYNTDQQVLDQKSFPRNKKHNLALEKKKETQEASLDIKDIKGDVEDQLQDQLPALIGKEEQQKMKEFISENDTETSDKFVSEKNDIPPVRKNVEIKVDPSIPTENNDNNADTNLNSEKKSATVFFKSKKEKRKNTSEKTNEPLSAVLSRKYPLNKEQQETFLDLFSAGTIPLGLRDLINLAQACGGTLTKTGANRCRIELENIYAHLLIDSKSLEAATTQNTVTITLHGGGHRQHRSQNHDRGEAPSYLVEQFKSAFTRAGITPSAFGMISDGAVGKAEEANTLGPLIENK